MPKRPPRTAHAGRRTGAPAPRAGRSAPAVARRSGALCVAAALALTELPLPARAAAPPIPRDDPGRDPDRRPDLEDRPLSPYPQDPDRGPVSPVSPVADPLAELAPPPLSAVPHAQRLEASGRYIDAALAWEQMWAETSDPRLLYRAALAYARAGRHARAHRLLTQVVAALTNPSEAVRAHLAERLAEQKALTVGVRLRVVESATGGLAPVPPHVVAAGTITVEPALSSGTSGFQDRHVLAGYQGDELRLDAGAWRVWADLPGFAPSGGSFQAQPTLGDTAWEIVVKRQLVAVDLRFSPPKALRGATFSLAATDHTPGFTVERPLLGPTQTVMLTTGTWQLRATSRRWRADRTLTIHPNIGPIAVVFTRGRADASGDDRVSLDRKALLGVLAYVAVGWYAGIGLMVGGANVQNKADERNRKLLADAGVDPKATPYAPAVLTQLDADFPTADYHRRLRLGVNLSFSGAAVAMSGLGMTLATLPAILRKPKRQMWIPFGVGLAAVAGGAAWTAHWVNAREELLVPATAEHRVYERPFDRLTGHQLGGSMILGIGLGLAALPPIYWLGNAIKRRKQARATAGAAPLATPGAVGLTLRGRF